MSLLEFCTQINLSKLKSKDYYKLLNNQICSTDQNGTRKCNKNIPVSNNQWSYVSEFIPKLCQELYLSENHFTDLFI